MESFRQDKKNNEEREKQKEVEVKGNSLTCEGSLIRRTRRERLIEMDSVRRN